MPEQSIEIIARVYNAFSDPLRRRIIEFLRIHGSTGFVELRTFLKVNAGSLYSNLDQLQGIVVQDEKKHYEIATPAESAVDRVVSEGIFDRRFEPVKETRSGFLTRELLLARSVFHFLNENPLRSFPLAMIIVFFGGWVSSQTNLEPLLLFYVNPSPGPSRAWFLLMFPLGWLATFAAAELLSVTIFHRKGGELGLMNGTAFAMLPLLIVPALSLVQFFSPARTAGYLVILIPVILQAWVVCLLSSSISISKGLKLERTALVGLVIMYLNVLVVLTALQLGLF